jgi:DNA repair protein RadC
MTTLSIKETNGRYKPADQTTILQAASEIIDHLFATGTALTSPDLAGGYLRVKLGHLKHEVFAAIFLDNQHRVLAYEELFRGTVDAASIYPREVVRAAIEKNAAAVIFAHNHPSGLCEPSIADKTITKKLMEALGTIDVRVLDHFIVGETVFSFGENGLLV